MKSNEKDGLLLSFLLVIITIIMTIIISTTIMLKNGGSKLTKEKIGSPMSVQFSFCFILTNKHFVYLKSKKICIHKLYLSSTFRYSIN